jgi:hypothetical protein
MKIRQSIFTAAFALSACVAVPALASTPGFNTIKSNIGGTLQSNDKLSLTYTFHGDLQSGILGAFADYDTGNTKGNAFSVAPIDFNFSSGTKNGSPSTALVVASAQVDTVNNSATAVIKNLSSGVADYSTKFIGLVSGASSYDVALNVSPVPVPAALPLFGGGLFALLGFRRKRKQGEPDFAPQAA